MQIIYADVLFFVNLAMDFLALYLTGRLLKRQILVTRLLIASVVGGVYGVCALFLEKYAGIDLFIQIAVSLLLCLIVFRRLTVGSVALFYGISFLLGGGMTAAFDLIHRWQVQSGAMETEEASGIGGIGWGAGLALALSIGAVLLAGLVRRRQMAGQVSVTLGYAGNRVRVEGIVDTAHFLTEPMSGLSVVLIPDRVAKSLFPAPLYEMMRDGCAEGLTDLDREEAKRVRLVPISSATGQGLLVAVRAEKCVIAEENRQVYLGISQCPEVLIPSDLVSDFGE